MITRFAPSPTGLIHLGNARTALIAYFTARSSGGEFILRIDDTDVTRIKSEYVDKIFTDLLWLGIEEDLCIKQSERCELYANAVVKLKESGRIYACYETPEELEIERRALLARGLPPVYRKKTEPKHSIRPPYYRFELNPDQVVTWEDKLRGKIVIDLHSTSDPIVIRENGTYTYMLPSVVDDIECRISTIIRGEDHISNTAVQIQIFEALGCTEIPSFAHMPLLKMRTGKMSKRAGGNEIQAFRENHIEPEVVCLYLLNLGAKSQATFENFKNYSNFNLENYSSSSSVTVLEDEVYALNADFLRLSTYEDLAKRLGGVSKPFWDAVKNNVKFISDVNYWWEICTTEAKIYSGTECNTQLIRDAILLLPQEEVSPETYRRWVGLIVEKCGYNRKEVHINLRLALTGKGGGPEMANILPFIGRKRILIRLNDLLS
ncbi:glutamate--tRNA ligase [Neorickettsia findlayensis]|uniref:Glutamate--tRNA ligase n=1 Tax=Neorickettsia findlayensis TaxID=2686014 RepID=A0A6P1G9U2_9RICK|nr:glutamate--tRNA ligase family protein [Neorickettsia findlayensis]QHD65237.1 glutamate--tRNA ligase [Neorickettsia findlayensis]